MRVLFIYRHFWPDSPPYATLLRSIGTRLSEDQYDVSVWSEQPSYRVADAKKEPPFYETLDGIKVSRLHRLFCSRNRLFVVLAQLLFPLRIIFKAARSRLNGEKYQAVAVATIPPVISGLMGYVVSRIMGAKFYYHVQDIYPEVGVCSGAWSEGGFRYRFLRRLDSFTCHAADMIITLSDDMKASLVNRGVSEKKIQVLNNFIIEQFDDLDRCISDQSFLEDGCFNVIFSGNIGKFQRLELLVEAGGYLQDIENLRIVFLGDGAKVDALKQQARGYSNVQFLDHQPYGVARSIIQQCDLGVVSLQNCVYKFAYPSKTLTYLGLGIPILAIVESESVLARQVTDYRLGLVPDTISSREIARSIRTVYESDDLHQSIKNSVTPAYETYFSKKHVLSKWKTVFETN